MLFTIFKEFIEKIFYQGIKKHSARGQSALCRFLLVGNVGEKSHGSCSLDSDGELALVLSAGAGDSLGEDLGALGDQLAKSCSFLVIDFRNLFNAELANLFLLAVSVVLTESGLCGSICCRRCGSGSSRSYYVFVFHIYIPISFQKMVDTDQKGRSSSLDISSNLGAPASDAKLGV